MRTIPIRRLLSKIIIIDNGCWKWVGAVQTSGYGYFWNGVKYQTTHRFMYQYYYGDLDDAFTIDHLCRNPTCCNPLHLEQVSQKVNFLRGNAPAAINKRKTHCKRGHKFTPDNIYSPPKHPTYRHCRTCQLDTMRRLRK